MFSFYFGCYFVLVTVWNKSARSEMIALESESTDDEIELLIYPKHTKIAFRKKIKNVAMLIFFKRKLLDCR